jgi:hypothetical protein
VGEAVAEAAQAHVSEVVAAVTGLVATRHGSLSQVPAQQLGHQIRKHCSPSTGPRVNSGSSLRFIPRAARDMPSSTTAEKDSNSDPSYGMGKVTSSTVLVQPAILELEARLKVQFTVIVTEKRVPVNNFADHYRLLSVEKFLQCQSLEDVHMYSFVLVHTACGR